MEKGTRRNFITSKRLTPLVVLLAAFIRNTAAFGVSRKGSASTWMAQRRIPDYISTRGAIIRPIGGKISLSTTALACQLLGMNCATPTDFSFSFSGFCLRGGETDIHSHGWGLAIHQDNGLRQFHDVQAAAESPMAKFLSSYPIRTVNMMGHIRYATVGNVDLSNVHPFSRELWGLQWCFCHNGEVPLFSDGATITNDGGKKKLKRLTCLGTGDGEDDNRCCQEEEYYHPIGTTDSEATFCAILNALRVRFKKLPSLPVLYDALQQLCDEIVSHDRDLTIMNFLLSCGPHTLWAYSWPGSRPGSKVWNGLYYTIRQYPFSTCHLTDMDLSVDFATCTQPEDCVSVIATAPLTDDEQWCEFQRGELLVFDQGRPQPSIADLFRVELNGHGLHSNVLDPPTLEEDMRKYNFEPQEFIMGDGI